jgi:hypothetical protein
VGLEIEGGEVIAHSNIMDIGWGDYEPRSHRRAFGQGQHVAALREPLLGSSHIPWLGGCSGRPCSVDQPGLVQYLRNNIGIVNPNPETLTVVGTVLPFGLVGRDGLLQGIEEWDGWLSSESFSITVPAFGWKQFNWTSVQDYSGDPFYTFFPHVGFVISLAPDREDLPYYAYASVIFSPDPSTGVPEFNDPMFIPAEPGCIVPISEGRGDP